MKLTSFSIRTLSALALSMTMTSITLGAEPANGRKASPSERKEAMLDQIIIKYRNENTRQLHNNGSSGNSGSSATDSNSTGNSAAQMQLQAQRLSVLQSAAQSFGARFAVKRQMVTGAWVYESSMPLKPAQMRALAAKLSAADPSIEYAEPDYIRYPNYVPTDPMYAGSQWDMQSSATQPGSLNLPAAWDISMGKGVVVAVLDTGYRPHPDLLPNLIPAPGGAPNQYGYNFITNPEKARITVAAGITSARGPDALDMGDWSTKKECKKKNSTWHGTHVAGTIAAAANNTGIIGVAPQAKILPLRVLGKCGGRDSDITEALAWAAGIHINGVPDNTNKANVANLSLGDTSVCTKTWSDVLQSVLATGMTVVFAAGNESRDTRVASPANCPGAITVAAVGIDGSRAYYSNYGPTATVSAPGGGESNDSDLITSTLPTGTTVSNDDTTYGSMSGTSMAAPHVAGVAALMLSVNPKLTPAQVKAILIKTARTPPANCAGCSAGMVDAAAAVKAAAGN